MHFGFPKKSSNYFFVSSLFSVPFSTTSIGLTSEGESSNFLVSLSHIFVSVFYCQSNFQLNLPILLLNFNFSYITNLQELFLILIPFMQHPCLSEDANYCFLIKISFLLLLVFFSFLSAFYAVSFSQKSSLIFCSFLRVRHWKTG